MASRPSASNSQPENAARHSPSIRYSANGSSKPPKYGVSAAYSAVSLTSARSGSGSGADLGLRPTQAAEATRATIASSGPCGSRKMPTVVAAPTSRVGPRRSFGRAVQRPLAQSAWRRRPRPISVSGANTSAAWSPAVRARSRPRLKWRLRDMRTPEAGGVLTGDQEVRAGRAPGGDGPDGRTARGGGNSAPGPEPLRT